VYKKPSQVHAVQREHLTFSLYTLFFTKTAKFYNSKEQKQNAFPKMSFSACFTPDFYAISNFLFYQVQK